MKHLSIIAVVLVCVGISAYSYHSSNTPTPTIRYVGQWACSGVLGTQQSKMTLRDNGAYDLFFPYDNEPGVVSSTLVKGKWRFHADGQSLILSPRTVQNVHGPSNALMNRFAYEIRWVVVYSDKKHIVVNSTATPAYDERTQSRYDSGLEVVCKPVDGMTADSLATL